MATSEQDPLAPITRDAARHLDGLAAAARPAPDFAAMLARARELDPDAVAAEALAHAESRAPVIPLARGGDARDDAGALAPFTAALRAELDARLDERRMASIPPPPLPRKRRAVAIALGVAAGVAAAVALLTLVAPDRLVRRPGDAGVAASRDGAAYAGGRAHPRASGHVSEDISLREPAAPASGPGAADVSPDPAPQTQPAPPAPAAPGDPDMSPGPASPGAPNMSPGPVSPGGEDMSPGTKRPRGGSVRAGARQPGAPPRPEPAAPAGPALEDEAQALWQRGELAAAERKYREILDLAGTGLRAELAFGDLFALARQIRGAAGQAAAWREYLERFPAGRFADDARAGLCQRAATDARATCWRDYLEHHPAGAHHEQARAALADDDPGAPP